METNNKNGQQIINEAKIKLNKAENEDYLGNLFAKILEKEATQFTTNVKRDSATEYLETYRHMELSEADIIRLAKDYFKLQLAQELQFRLTRSLLG